MTELSTDDVLDVLKRALKNRRMTYLDLARAIGMSESGVKKLLTSDDLSLHRLSTICDALDVPVADVVAEAAGPRTEVYRPTDAQREAFVAEPRLLLTLWALGEERGDVQRARERLGLELRTMRRLVRQLAAVVMLEVVDVDSVLLLHPRVTDWRMPADVGRAVIAPLQDALLSAARARIEASEPDAVELGLGRLRLTADSIAELKHAMRALLSEFSARSRRERALHPRTDLTEVGAMTVLAPFGLADAMRAFVD